MKMEHVVLFVCYEMVSIQELLILSSGNIWYSLRTFVVKG